MSTGRRWKAATLVVLLLGLLVAGLWFLGHRVGLATTERRLVAILALLLLSVTVVLLASLRGAHVEAVASGKRLCGEQIGGLVSGQQPQLLLAVGVLWDQFRAEDTEP